ncbi:hypothetical protein CBL_07911 [Carabus blaptoides fortunei]
MDPDRVARRRSTLFQKIQLDLTHGTTIRKRISAGKFPMSSVGIIKIFAILILISAAITFLSLDTCHNTADWYDWLFALATCLAAAITIVFYAVFSLGLALKYPDFWFVSDIVFCIILALFIIVASVLTLVECKSKTAVQDIPAPLGICGAVLLLIAAAALYIMYKHKEIKDATPQVVQRKNPMPAVGSDV